MTNKTLLLIFLFFVGLYLIFSKVLSSRATSDFSTEVIKVDTAQITTIEISPQGGAAYAIHRTDRNWIVTNGNVNVRAASAQLKAVLDQVDTIRTIQLVSSQKEDWIEYGVGPAQGSRIKIYLADGSVEDFIIGKTAFDATLQRSIAYLRLTHQNEVYSVNGFLPFQLEKHFDDFRSRELFFKAIQFFPPDRFLYQNQDTQILVIRQEGSLWAAVGNEPLDSARIYHYLDWILKAKGRIFVDDFDELSAPRFFHQSIRFYFDDIQDSVSLTCYRDSTRALPFIIHSSQNPKAYFGSDSTGLYQGVFEGLRQLLFY